MGKSGFSLLEILIVIAIMIILAGALTPILSSSKAKANEAKAKTDLEAIKTAAVMLYADHDVWPPDANTTGEDLLDDSDSSISNWKGPYIDTWNIDPWKRPYEIKDGANNTRYAASQGPTAGFEVGFPTGTDDIWLLITPDHTK